MLAHSECWLTPIPDPTCTGVPVSAWFVASEVPRMAEAVQQYASEGHVWMKYHVSPFHNVLEQTAAMQAVAPEGFKVHYDFTM